MLKWIPALALIGLFGQPGPSAAAMSAPAMYADAQAKEQAVRQAIAARQPAEAMVRAVRTVVVAYEAIVRRYPTSGYCDDALWNAAQISLELSRQLHDPTHAATAARLLKRLSSEYPASKYARQAPDIAATVDVAAVQAPKVPTVVAATPLPAAGVLTVAPAPRGLATLRGITRVVLPEVVRVTIDLSAEVPFRQEELHGPSRLFFDFAGTKAGDNLSDRTVRFDGDADIVRQVRVGRQADDTVRVVLDTTGAASCSVSPLYTPYRLVVDCVRDAARLAAAASPPVARPTPLTPATFARKSAAIPAANVKAMEAPLPSRPRDVFPALTAPARPLAARTTVALAFVPAVLYARAVGPTVLRLPLGRPTIAASVFAALAAEPPPPISARPISAPPVSAPAVRAASVPAPPLAAAANVPAAVATRPLPAPAAPARNLDGGFSMARQLGLGVSRIVIDPGHGGHDPGAKGSGITEAALVLDIALRLEALLQKQPDVEVILTRRDDEFVPLEARTAIANRAAADLFLSIHLNASAVAQAAGVETYFLNFATNKSAASVATRENATSGQPMSSLPDFVKAIALNNKLDESRDFATQVQRSLVQTLRPSNQGIRDLGVKQAPFVVLIGASMPSVLAEVSFVTNAQEARLLKGQNYRQRIAEALFAAVQKYQTSLSGVSRVAAQQE